MMRSPPNSRSRISRRRRMINALTMGPPKPGSSARAPDLGCRDFQNFGLFRLHARCGQRGGALQHRNVADEVALPARGEDLLRTFPCFEDFGFAAQDNRQAEIALPCFEDKFATPQRAPLSE